MPTNLRTLALAAALTLAASGAAYAQAGGLGAGPMNSKSGITGQSGKKGMGRMRRHRMMHHRRHRSEVETGQAAIRQG